MKLSDLINAEHDLPPEFAGLVIKGLTADSRDVRPGFLFAALPGTVTDGARFIGQALGAGAIVILADEGAVLGDLGGAALFRSKDPRRALALIAAKFYGHQPKTMAAITGTNGKTSVAHFLQQIWSHLGLKAASLGTLGVMAPGFEEPLAHTTPEPVRLQRILADLANIGVGYGALEVSSHGLAQCRADGVVFKAAAFTNITRDHLDYHPSFENYFAAKAGLFTRVLEPGTAAVIYGDTKEADEIARLSAERGLDVMRVGPGQKDIDLVNIERHELGQHLAIKVFGKQFDIDLPLAGDFQAANVLVAAGLAIACGGAPEEVFACIPKLTGPKGRLERVAVLANGARVFVDYAHTPDALKTALEALRPYALGALAVVFGCGGDRDKGKRPQMGAIACAHADEVYVTDDNPRSEQPATIRSEILATCNRAREIGDRHDAIKAAMAALGTDDILLVAGKGHETGQIVGDEVLPFSDHDVIAEISGEMN